MSSVLAKAAHAQGCRQLPVWAQAKLLSTTLGIPLTVIRALPNVRTLKTGPSAQSSRFCRVEDVLRALDGLQQVQAVHHG